MMTSQPDMVESVGEWLRLRAPLSLWRSRALVLPGGKRPEVARSGGRKGRRCDGGALLQPTGSTRLRVGSFVRATFLLGILPRVPPHEGGEVEAEQGQRALPWGGEGSACLVMSCHPKGVSQGRWPEVEASVGPRGLRLGEEGRGAGLHALAGCLQSCFGVLQGNRPLQTPRPDRGPRPGKKNKRTVMNRCIACPQQARAGAREVQALGWWLLSFPQLPLSSGRHVQEEEPALPGTTVVALWPVSVCP